MDMAKPGEAALLLGNYRAALPVARRMRAAGFRVVISRDWPEGYVQFSRNVQECWDNPDRDDPDALMEALAAYLQSRPDIRIVAPVMEDYAKAVALHRDRLPADRIYATPPAATVLTCLDKEAMGTLAEDAGVLKGPWRCVRDHAGLQQAVSEIGGPLVIKPVESGRRLQGAKAIILSRPDRLAEAAPDWPAGEDRLIVQAFAAGRRLNVYFAAERGALRQVLVSEVKETDAHDGTGYNTWSVTQPLDDAVLAATRSLLGRLKYHGVGLAQFIRRDDDGRLVFLEINPRYGSNHAIVEDAGLDMVGFAVDAATGAPIRAGLQAGAAGRRFVWTSMAAMSALRDWHARRTGFSGLLRRLGGIAARSARAHVRGAWRFDDPVPALVFTLRKAPGLSGLVRSRARRMKAGRP